MRRGVGIFVLFNVCTVSYLVYTFWTLITLLLIDGSADQISRAEIPGEKSDPFANNRQLIPKIIHQTYANTSLPARWKSAQQSCLDLHKDYEYKLWTDKSARDFIAAEYPWFLETFDGYRFPIQRADAIRYFVLAYYGGIYIDLDDGCQRKLDPLLTYPAWVRRTVPTGISNDVMGSVPHHPFFLKVIDSLPRYDRSWGLPYITVMGATGPLFLSVIWRHYVSGGDIAESDRVRILFPDEYIKHSWSFFRYHKGNSWHQGDVQLILWMGKHWMSLTALGFVVAGFVFAFMWWAYGRMLGGSPKSQQFRNRLPFWRRYSAKKHDGKLVSYELLSDYTEDRLEA